MRAESNPPDPVMQARDRCVDELRAARNRAGGWSGRLSSSALATATAVGALHMAGGAADAGQVRGGVDWLVNDQNDDGGWGDSPESPSNLPCTLIVRSVLAIAEAEAGVPDTVRAAEAYLAAHDCATPDDVVQSMERLCGKDRTFAVPILVTCALAGRVPWVAIPRLPFEASLLPRALLRWTRLEVVSYALPALIAIGRLLHAKAPTRVPGLRTLRSWAAPRVLPLLQKLQPRSGGYLEAQPLTAFVTMALAATGEADHPVALRALDFLRQTVREDGSWPIDTDLSLWLTSHALLALDSCGAEGPAEAVDLLQSSQGREIHPYTGSAPGGWAWTDRDGGVFDADDTAGALLALRAAGAGTPESFEHGVRWLLQLQNRDGGWPTFCRGWGALPFDASAPELTAHAMRALMRCAGASQQAEARRATDRGLRYLKRAQRADGSWDPLWFGHQLHPRRANPVLGTGRVLLALAEPGVRANPAALPLLQKGLRYLRQQQHDNGGWGPGDGVPPSVEETALAVEALLAHAQEPEAWAAASRGATYLASRLAASTPIRPTPIGLYFANLWYSERLYPWIWSARALGCFLGARAVRNKAE